MGNPRYDERKMFESKKKLRTENGFYSFNDDNAVLAFYDGSGNRTMIGDTDCILEEYYIANEICQGCLLEVVDMAKEEEIIDQFLRKSKRLNRIATNEEKNG